MLGNRPFDNATELDIELAGPVPINVLISSYLPEGKEGARSRVAYYSAARESAARHKIYISDSAFNLRENSACTVVNRRDQHTLGGEY